MIYRSRYLDRLSFSPLGYRQDTRPKPATRLQPRSSEATPGAGRVGVTLPQGHLAERAPYLSSRELRDVVGRCEKAIMSGQAQIEDYEAFVICQQELSSRA